MIYAYEYDSSYNPSMPVVDIELVNPKTGKNSQKFKAIIDSGADTCIIPESYLKDLEVEPTRKVRMRGINDISTYNNLYVVQMKIGPSILNVVQVLAMKDCKEAILGRDVLNHFVITLDGLASTTEISD